MKNYQFLKRFDLLGQSNEEGSPSHRNRWFQLCRSRCDQGHSWHLGFFLLPKLPQIMSLTCSWSWRGCGRNWRHRCLCYPAGIDQHWHSVGGCRALKLYIWGPLFFWLAGRASQFRGLQVDLRVDWDHRECALEGLALDLEWLLNHLLIL